MINFYVFLAMSDQLRFFLHFSEQYLTSLQSFSHFFLHTKGLSHRTHTLFGRSDFLTFLGI